MITRRTALKTTVLASLALSVANSQGAPAAAAAGPFTVPPLGYSFAALEPYIDTRTMEIHHDLHHGAYVKNLNLAVAKLPATQQTWSIETLLARLDQLPGTERTAILNNGGGHYNHTLFWTSLKKDGGQPTGPLGEAIRTQFGSHETFLSQITEKAMKTFGSGWAWLSLGKDRQLVVESTPNQNTPLSDGRIPLLGIDVWEHAYYLKYQNKRADYLAAILQCIDWETLNSRYTKAA